MDCVKTISYCFKNSTSSLRSVGKKFRSSKYGRVSEFPFPAVEL